MTDDPIDLMLELKRIDDRLNALELKLDRILEEIRRELTKLSRGVGVY